ncbi:MAG: site-specific tyrosine recombinase XerD [Streptosporangiaceae bacterium]
MTGTAQAASTFQAISGYLDHLLVERGLAANTLASYRRDLSRYQQVMTAAGRTEMGEVTSADIASYLAGLREGDADHPPLAASSAGRAMAAVRGLHAFACAQGLTAADPARPVTPPAPPRRLPKAISVAEVERLLDAAGPGPQDDPRGIRDRALLEFLYATGARISEATALDVDGLTLDSLARDGEPAVLLEGKGGKQRVVPLGRYAAAALDAYLVRARPALAAGATRTVPPAVFLNARGGRLTRQGAWAVLRAAAERANLLHVSPHTLRHSFATHMLDGGADIRVVQELLGHASVTTTQIYTLVTVEKLREVYAAAHPRALG